MTTHISGPPAMPILGRVGNDLLFGADPLAYLRRVYHNYGLVAAGVHNDSRWILAFGPDCNRTILTHPDRFASFLLSMPAPRDAALRRLVSGLLSMNGDQHRRHRQLMMPLFAKTQVTAYRDVMVELTQDCLDHWQIGQQLDLARAMRELTFRIVCSALFGRERIGIDVGHSIETWLTQFTSIAVNGFPYNLPFTPYRRLLHLSEQLEAMIHTLIANKRVDPSAQSDVLAILIQARDAGDREMSDAELVGHIHLLFIAGHETSANALSWTLFLLAHHPAILADVYDEVRGVLRGDAPRLEHLDQLPLLECVIKESLRLLPPAPFGARCSTTPFTLGPYSLPTHTTVLFSQYITHHMPELYAEPDRFIPARWTTINPSPYEYLPFGAGPRMCLGAAFAMLELKIVLSMLLQRYQLILVPNTTIDYRVRLTLAPKPGIPMIVGLPQQRVTSAHVRGAIRKLIQLPDEES
jgi:cytochrome P450